LAQRAVRCPTIVIGDVRRQNSTQIGFAVQTFRSRRSYPSLSEGIGSKGSERRANLPYFDAPHATIEGRTIAAVESKIAVARGPRCSIPRFAVRPARCGMPRHFNVEDLSVSESEDVKRLEQDRRDAEKVASPHVRCMPGQEPTPRLGLGRGTLAHIWPRSLRKPETLTLPTRLGCAFDPKAILGSHASDESLKLSGSSGDHPLLDEKIATSSTPSNPRAASPELFPVSQSATDCANR
jgi:hypothetical protein